MNMRKLSINIVLIAAFAVAASGQCVSTPEDSCIEVKQSTLDRAMKAVSELTEARKTIEALQRVTVSMDVERAAYKNALEVSASAIEIFKKGIADRDRIIELQEKAILALSQLNEKLIQQMGKKPSAFTKFMNALKTLATIAFGIGIGRGL